MVSINGDENTFEVDPVFEFNPILDKYELNQNDKIDFGLNHADRKAVAQISLNNLEDTGADQEIYLLSDPDKLQVCKVVIRITDPNKVQEKHEAPREKAVHHQSNDELDQQLDQHQEDEQQHPDHFDDEPNALKQSPSQSKPKAADLKSSPPKPQHQASSEEIRPTLDKNNSLGENTSQMQAISNQAKLIQMNQVRFEDYLVSILDESLLKKSKLPPPADLFYRRHQGHPVRELVDRGQGQESHQRYLPARRPASRDHHQGHQVLRQGDLLGREEAPR